MTRAESEQTMDGFYGDLGNLGSLGGGMSAADLAAYGKVKGSQGDFSYLKRMFNPQAQGLDGAVMGGTDSVFANLGGFDPATLDPADIQHFFAEFQRNPQGLQKHLKEEYRALPADQQNAMLDALASLGYASRAWWERFFRS